MYGGSGDDTYVVDNVRDRVIEYPGQGIDKVIASVSYVLPADVENLVLAENFVISGFGNNLSNNINGNRENNFLSGGGGSDTLNGGAGNDTLFGGTGSDTLIGGIGADNFQLFFGDSHDLITDFGRSQGDKIVLRKYYFRALNSNFGNGFSISGEFASVASDSEAETNPALITYNRNNGRIFYNPNSSLPGFAATWDGGGHFATFSGNPNLIASDFIISR